MDAMNETIHEKDEKKRGIKRPSEDSQQQSNNSNNNNNKKRNNESGQKGMNVSIQQKTYGHATKGSLSSSSDTTLLCDVCFTEEAEADEDGYLPEGHCPLISCRTCKLVVHSVCFGPESEVDQDGFFTCNACSLLEEQDSHGPSPQKTITTPSKKKRESFSPKPLNSDIEAKGDGRVYPSPKSPRDIDIYCALCLRRDVIGGMKPTFGTTWCHLACSMSSSEIYSKGNRLTGITNAIQKTREKTNRVMKKVFDFLFLIFSLPYYSTISQLFLGFCVCVCSLNETCMIFFKKLDTCEFLKKGDKSG